LSNERIDRFKDKEGSAGMDAVPEGEEFVKKMTEAREPKEPKEAEILRSRIFFLTVDI